MKDKNKTFLILGLMAFLANGDNYATAPLLINISKDLNLTISAAAMSVASFNLFVGGAIGTWVNGIIMKSYGITQIFYNAAYIILIIGILTSIFVARFEARKRKDSYNLTN